MSVATGFLAEWQKTAANFEQLRAAYRRLGAVRVPVKTDLSHFAPQPPPPPPPPGRLVELRKQDREYLQKKIDNSGQEVYLFSKITNPYEKTLYFFQDAFLVSISYTATAEKDEAEGQVLQMQKTFKILSLEERQKQQKNPEEGLQ